MDAPDLMDSNPSNVVERPSSFATFCHKGPNTAPQLATVHDDVERLAEENNGERQCAPIVSGLGGRCSIRTELLALDDGSYSRSREKRPLWPEVRLARQDIGGMRDSSSEGAI